MDISQETSNIEEMKRQYYSLSDQLKDMEDIEPSDPRRADLTLGFLGIAVEILGQYPEISCKEQIPDTIFNLCVYPTIRSHRRKRMKKSQGMDDFQARLDGYIEFYKGLVKFYLDLIDPTSSDSETVSISQNGDLSQDTLTDADKPATIKILYRFLISLGDLHRYKRKNAEAIRHYESAIFLSPGQGNPYNQLAVLQGDQSCKALYYYARSSMGSHGAYASTLTNIEYLYTQNLKWLKENYNTAKQGSEENDKGFQSELFCAQFVELHKQLQLEADPKKIQDNSQHFHQIMIKLDNVIEGLRELISNQWGSDSFLCMMVAINAFTVDKGGSPSQILVAQILAFRFGIALAKRFEDNLTKKLGLMRWKIHGLAPFLIVCDYLLTFKSCEDESFLHEEQAFWSKVCIIANKVRKEIQFNDLERVGSGKSLPKEYESYKGFTPFETFIPKPNEFITYEDAKGIVPKLKMQENDRAETNYFHENRIKFERLFFILKKQSNCVMLSEDIGYSFLKEATGADLESSVLVISDNEDDIISITSHQYGSESSHSMPDEMLVTRKYPEKSEGSTSSPTVPNNKNLLMDFEHESRREIAHSSIEKSMTKSVTRTSSVPLLEKNTNKRLSPLNVPDNRQSLVDAEYEKKGEVAHSGTDKSSTKAVNGVSSVSLPNKNTTSKCPSPLIVLDNRKPLVDVDYQERREIAHPSIDKLSTKGVTGTSSVSLQEKSTTNRSPSSLSNLDNRQLLVDVEHQKEVEIEHSRNNKLSTEAVVKTSSVSLPDNSTKKKRLSLSTEPIVPQGSKPRPIPPPTTCNSNFSKQGKETLDILSNIPTKNPFVPNGSYTNYRRNKEVKEQKYAQNLSTIKDREVWGYSLYGLAGYLGFEGFNRNCQGSKELVKPDDTVPKERLTTTSLPQSLLGGDDRNKFIQTKNPFFHLPAEF